jgi:hypothetical protein
LSRKTKNDKPTNTPDEAAGWNTDSLRFLGGLFSIFIVLGGAFYGLDRLRSHVTALPEYNPKMELELAEPPEWVQREGWQPRILSAVKINSSAPSNQLVRDVADQLSRSGWIAKVNYVTQGMDGKIHVSCEYRRPIAMVYTQGGYVAVDHQGVRLPEFYNRVENDSGWMRIMGIESPVPEVGEQFKGEDAAAAVRLASLIFDQEFSSRINGIDVSNFRGRRDKRANHIRLRTRDGGKIDWGSAIGEEIEEPSPREKLRTIALYFRRGSPQAEGINVSIYGNGVVQPSDNLIRTADSSGR